MSDEEGLGQLSGKARGGRRPFFGARAAFFFGEGRLFSWRRPQQRPNHVLQDNALLRLALSGPKAGEP